MQLLKASTQPIKTKTIHLVLPDLIIKVLKYRIVGSIHMNLIQMTHT